MLENTFLLIMAVAIVCIVAALGGWLVERGVRHDDRVHYTWRGKQK